MPYNESTISQQWTKPLVDVAARIYSNIFGLRPFRNCFFNIAKYKVDLNSLKYSQKELLRLTFQSHRYGPLFYKEVSNDAQFDWYLNQYPELELDHTYMQSGLSGLHISDSVSRDIY